MKNNLNLKAIIKRLLDNKGVPCPPSGLKKSGSGSSSRKIPPLQLPICCCRHFFSVMVFEAMRPARLAHCLLRYATQPKSQSPAGIASKTRFARTNRTVQLMPEKKMSEAI
jgi:hypothetical protein